MSDGLKMKYFVLSPEGTKPHNVASRAALRAYADAMIVHESELAVDVRCWANDARDRALKEPKDDDG